MKSYFSTYECSCFIKFIKRVLKKRYNVRLADHSSAASRKQDHTLREVLHHALNGGKHVNKNKT